MAEVVSGSRLYRGKTSELGQIGIIDERRRLETGNFIYELGAHPGILTRIMTMAQRKGDTIESLHYDTLENSVIQHFDNTVVQATASATTLVVENAHLWLKEYTWQNVNTMETFLVTADPVILATTHAQYDATKPNRGTVTVKRAYGEAEFPAKIVKTTDRLQCVGPAMREAGQAAPAQSTVIQPVRNGMRRFSHTIRMSDITSKLSSSAFYGMSERERLERDMRYKAIWDEEASMLDGQFVYDYPGKVAGGLNGSVLESGLTSWRGTTRGLIPTIHKFAEDNIYEVNGVLSYRLLVEFLAHLSKYNPGGMQKMIGKGGNPMPTTTVRYIALCGDTAIAALTDLLHNKVQTTPASDSYGFGMARITAPFGSLDISRHVQLDGPRSNWMVLLDPRRIGMKTLRGWNNIFKPLNQGEKYQNVWDLQKVCGLWIGNAELFGILKGVESAI